MTVLYDNLMDRSDEDLPSLPETSFSLGIQYDWDTSFGSWTARADAYYRDEMYWGLFYGLGKRHHFDSSLKFLLMWGELRTPRFYGIASR